MSLFKKNSSISDPSMAQAILSLKNIETVSKSLAKVTGKIVRELTRQKDYEQQKHILKEALNSSQRETLGPLIRLLLQDVTMLEINTLCEGTKFTELARRFMLKLPSMDNEHP